MDERSRLPVRVLPVLVALILALLLMPGPAVLSTQPPTVSYPVINKILGGETLTGFGDDVEFTVTVWNELEPTPPLVPTTWYNVRATDVLSPGLAIDTVNVTGSYDDYNVVGNTVVVTATTLAPGEYFAFDIHCTVVAIPEPDGVFTNTAQLDFEYEDGQPEGPITSDPVTVTVLRRTFLPVVVVNTP